MISLSGLKAGDGAVHIDHHGVARGVTIDAVDGRYLRVGRSRFARHDGKQVGSHGYLITVEVHHAKEARASAISRLWQLGVEVRSASRIDPVQLLAAMKSAGLVPS